MPDSEKSPANVGETITGNIPGQGGAPLQDLHAIRAAIRKKYAEVSVSADGKFSYPTGRNGAENLQYDRDAILQAPARLLESFCGVGNPFSLGKIPSGGALLDYGCGAGFDLYVASRLVGVSGRVCGVDLTEEMVHRVVVNMKDADVSNYEVRQIDAEDIPYPDNFFDVVISNGVINLSPFKLNLFREIYRVLKPGGCIQFADVVLEHGLPAAIQSSPDAWSQ